MIRFGSPAFLVLGAALVLVVALSWLRYERRRGRALASFAGDLARRLAHAESDGQRHLRWALRVLGLLALVIAAAAPRWGDEVVRVSARGSDLVLVFDTSKSMDARDVPPTRLEEAEREALALLDDLSGDRVGVVAFAGDAVALSPLTLDRSAARLLIESLHSDVVSTPGSDLGRGLRAALRLLPEGEAGQQAIVLFTDGEDLEGGLDEATAAIERRGVKVFAVGVGTPAGETIPILDERGYQVGVKTDVNGQAVVSRLDVAALRAVARRTRGQFFAAQHPGGELARLKAALAGVGKGAREGRLGSRPVERFPLFALAAWLLFVASWLLPERRTVLPRALSRGRPRAAALLVAGSLAGLLLLPAPARAAHPLVEGNRLYAAGDYRGAIRVYQEGLKKSPGDPALLANLGAALFRTNDWKGAEESFARAQAAAGRRPEIAARAGHGRGNALFHQERYREALDAYRSALEARPFDADARFNYELTLRKLRPKEEPPQDAPTPPDDPNQQGGGGGGAGAAQPQPAAPQNQPQSPQGAGTSPSPASGQPGQLSREEAERLLEALQNGERQARSQQRRGRGGEAPRAKDW